MTMARNTRLTPYDEQLLGAFDEDASGREYMAYGSTTPTTTEVYALPEDPMPLFLSNDNDEEPRQRGFGSGGESAGARAVAWRRLFKVGVFAAAAAAIVVAVLSVENPLALFGNAKASLIGSSTDQSAAAQPPNPQPAPAVQLASTAPPTQVMPPPVDVRAALPSAKVPTRDDIALALRAAHQNQGQTEAVQQPAVQQPAVQPPAVQPPAVQPPAVQQPAVQQPAVQLAAVQPAAVAQPPAVAPRRLDPDELAALLKRAKGLIAVGDIAPARLLLERAADAQEPSAALMLAQTYDPAVLGTPDMRSIMPDPEMARSWYQKAARFGSLDAQQRLAQMQK
jgi:TPR repeat protein